MWFDHVPAQHRVPPSLMLHDLYDVRADASYDISNGRQPQQLHLVFHTQHDAGHLWLSEARIELRAHTLFVAPWCEIRRYRTVGEQWGFWCAVVEFSSGFDLRLRRALPCPFDETAAHLWPGIFSLLREQTAQAELLASLRLAAFLQQQAWKSGETRQPQLPHEREIREQLRRLHDQLDAAPTVNELAAELGLSSRHYRQVFRAITGEAPKAMIDRLRLARACELLRFTNLTVSRVAAQVGYSTVQQFSQAFRQTHQASPTEWRRRRTLG